MDRRRRILMASALALPAGLSSTFAQRSAKAASKRPRAIRISRGYGMLYLPLLVMERLQLLEMYAGAADAGRLDVEWITLDGGSSINDAMMTGSVDFAGTGAPAFIELWSSAKGIPQVEVIGISGLSSTALWLNTNRSTLHSLRDFNNQDRIAVPGIKTSLSAVVLQMMAAKVLGPDHFAALDALTVNFSHPEAMQALILRQQRITAHISSAPYSFLEVKQPGIHRIANSANILGNLTLDVVYSPKKFTDANPDLVSVFLNALTAANTFIATHKKDAAKIFIENSPAAPSFGDVVAILEDPDTTFSVMPNKLMDYVTFLSSTRAIRLEPKAWTEMFVPQLFSRL